jgi:hypothetical protein
MYTNTMTTMAPISQTRRAGPPSVSHHNGRKLHSPLLSN